MNLFALLLLLVVLAFVLMAFLNHRLFVAALNTLERIGAPKVTEPVTPAAPIATPAPALSPAPIVPAEPAPAAAAPAPSFTGSAE